MKKFFAKLLTIFSAFVAQFVTFDENSRIGQWYHTNGIYKFPIGSTIALANICLFGYGVRPVGVVEGYTNDGKYIVKMEYDVDGNFFDWIKGKKRYVPEGRRSSQREVHFKQNIECHFRKIPRADAELAYA